MSENESTPQRIYDQLGGDAGIRRLTRQFYHYMDTLPEAQPIRRMHPDDLSSSEEKLYLFLSGWTGGPQLYIEKHGHPMLRKRHFPFPIGDAERDQWMLCMEKALRDHEIAEPLLGDLIRAFTRIAGHMRNQDSA